IVRQGKIVETGSLTDLRHLTRTSVDAVTDRPADALAALPGVHGLHAVDGHVRFEVDGDHLAAVVRQLGDLGVQGLTVRPPTLEQLLLRHYGDQFGHNGAAEMAR
ncbi:ABC transporter ATP-binding protein, partial [Micromonospora sp. NPDC051296]